MDDTVVIAPEKRLQRNLGFLSKRMTGIVVKRMATRLCQKRTISSYEEQVVTSKATDMEKASTLMQMILKKGTSACNSFITCLGLYDPKLYETVTGCPAQVTEEDHPSEDILHIHPTISETQPSNNRTCVINIHNSSLVNCIIGNNNKRCDTCDQHALLSQNDAMNVDKTKASHDQLISAQDPESGNSIHMEYSHVEYVTIGDDNTMIVTEYVSSDTEEDTEDEPDVNG